MGDRAYERYVEAVEDIVALAKKDLESVVAELDTSRKKDTRDALLVIVPAIVDKYGEMAAAVAAEHYEQERHRQIGGAYHAKLGSADSLEAIESTVRYACGHLFGKEDNDGR